MAVGFMFGQLTDEDVNRLRVIAVHNDAVLNTLACVQNRCVVAATEALTDSIQG
jgi:hypothetical protein